MPFVVLDTDFLSAFLKIEQLTLVPQLDHQLLRTIIDDLWLKDYYKFSQEIVKLLLSK